MSSGSAGFIRSVGLAKSVHDSEQFRSDAADARTVGRDVASMIAGRRLIFRDETGVTINMVRYECQGRNAQRVNGFALVGDRRITAALPGSTARAS